MFSVKTGCRRRMFSELTAVTYAHYRMLVILLYFLVGIHSARSYDVCYDSTSNTYRACSPSLGDVIMGSNVVVSVEPEGSTCGTPPSNFRLLGDRSDQQYTCDASSESLQHPESYIIDSDTTTWWKSTNQPDGFDDHNITVTVSFNKMFRLAGDVLITFYSGRPRKMVLEKSTDFGVTWSALQYYARNCQEFAAELSGETVSEENPTAVICTNKYAEISTRATPGRKVEFLVSERFDLLLGPPPGVNFSNLYAVIDSQMLNFLQFTDLRLRLIEPATDGRTNYDMYYYAISRLQVVARCFCNLHAAYCNYAGIEVTCDCQHNTQGKNCESCLPLYNERPWKRGSYISYDKGTANECTKCECNDHALSCTYNATYGRGICDSCLHNTMGYHCEQCAPTFYPNVSTTLNAIDRCIGCDCEPLGVKDNSMTCTQTESPTISLGQCTCKDTVTGRQCNMCDPGYYGLFLEPQGTCIDCECNLDGTQGQSTICDQDTGQCQCKRSTEGRQCGACADTFYAFPTGNPQNECTACDCDKGGSLSSICDKITGKCPCRNGVEGDKCDRAVQGNYVPAIDVLGFEPLQSGPCSLTSDLWTSAAPFDGPGYAECTVTDQPATVEFENLGGAMIQKALEWPYSVAIRYTSAGRDVTGTISAQVVGDAVGDLAPLSTRLAQPISPGCPIPQGPVGQVTVTLPPGTSTAFVSGSSTISLDARCQYKFELQIQDVITPVAPDVSDSASENAPPPTRRRRATDSDPSITIDSLLLLPALSNADNSTQFDVYANSEDPARTLSEYNSCLQSVSALTSRLNAMLQAPCDSLFFSLSADLYDGAQGCQCNTEGSGTLTPCEDLGGQCPCKSGISGRSCDVCLAGYFNFTENGCTPCSCHPHGSQHGSCDVISGQCPCRTNIGQLSDNPAPSTSAAANDSASAQVYDGTCSRCQENFYGINSGLGCSPCECNSQGSASLQCLESGQCPCKETINGAKCDRCQDKFFGFGADLCTACNCFEPGSTSGNCDQTSGVCTCKTNVEGDKCSDCKTAFFNLVDYNPNGCQPCFCYNHGVSCTSADGFQLARLAITTPTADSNYSLLLGDQHVSYGQRIRLWLQADFNLEISDETLITLEGNAKQIIHQARPGTIVYRDDTLQYEARLFEHEWSLMGNGSSTLTPTAQDFLALLADVARVKHITEFQGQAIRVTYLELESAALQGPDMTGEENVTFVEQCTCQDAAKVSGLSCEKCLTGNRRQDAATVSSYDICVACDCNGRGATDPPECNELTGICLNCRNGTEGDQCESCASFVIGPECDQCQIEYWGMRADGCRECNCSSPGSQSAECEQTDGQCTCADHVVGRTCDKCEENYHGLSAQGCIKCDACYDEVQVAVSTLRQQQDLVMSNISAVRTEDSKVASITEAFAIRLQAAITDTETLISFLTSAEQSETEVNDQIAQLNATLYALTAEILLIESNKTVDIEATLAQTETLLDSANSARTRLESNVKAAFSKLALLQPNIGTLNNLATSLTAVLQYLRSLVDVSSSEFKLIEDLQTLDVSATRANDLANSALERARALLKVHQSTTSTLLTLESTISTVVSSVTRSLISARGLATGKEEIEKVEAQLQSKLRDLSNFTIDEESIAGQTTANQRLTSSYQTQLTAESNLFTSVYVNTREAATMVEDLDNQTLVLTTDTASIKQRTVAAEQNAIQLQSAATTLFESAKNIRSTLNNFTAVSAEVQANAQTSLEIVSTVHNASKTLINQSQELLNSLLTLQQAASSAKEAAQLALQMINQKQQELIGVSAQADQLQTHLSNEVDPSEEHNRNLNNTRDKIIDPAVKDCDQVKESVASFKTSEISAEETTTEALVRTANVTQRATEILARLRTLQPVNPAAASELLIEINTARTTTNVDNLNLIVNQLKMAKNIQDAEIDKLKSLKDGLSQRISALKTIQEQIVNN